LADGLFLWPEAPVYRAEQGGFAMAEVVAAALTDQLYAKLQKEQFVLLSTIDAETGGPWVSAVSWVYAPDPGRIRVAVGHRSRIVANVEANPRVVLTVVGPDATYAVFGRAQVAEKPMEGVVIQLARIDVMVEEVRNVMFYGAKIVQEPAYEKTYDEEAAAKLDRQVLGALQR
jgi:Pyridoxamine 5'-phosphate oxidase